MPAIIPFSMPIGGWGWRHNPPGFIRVKTNIERDDVETGGGSAPVETDDDAGVAVEEEISFRDAFRTLRDSVPVAAKTDLAPDDDEPIDTSGISFAPAFARLREAATPNAERVELPNHPDGPEFWMRTEVIAYLEEMPDIVEIVRGREHALVAFGEFTRTRAALREVYAESLTRESLAASREALGLVQVDPANRRDTRELHAAYALAREAFARELFAGAPDTRGRGMTEDNAASRWRAGVIELLYKKEYDAQVALRAEALGSAKKKDALVALRRGLFGDEAAAGSRGLLGKEGKMSRTAKVLGMTAAVTMTAGVGLLAYLGRKALAIGGVAFITAALAGGAGAPGSLLRKFLRSVSKEDIHAVEADEAFANAKTLARGESIDAALTRAGEGERAYAKAERAGAKAESETRWRVILLSLGLGAAAAALMAEYLSEASVPEAPGEAPEQEPPVAPREETVPAEPLPAEGSVRAEADGPVVGGDEAPTVELPYEAPPVLVLEVEPGDGAYDLLLGFLNRAPDAVGENLIRSLGLPEDANNIDIARALAEHSGMVDNTYHIDADTSLVSTSEIVVPQDAQLSLGSNGDIIFSSEATGSQVIATGNGAALSPAGEWPMREVPVDQPK